MMLCHVVCPLAVFVQGALCVTSDILLTPSEDDFVAKTAKLIAENYDALLNASTSFQSTLDTCLATTNSTRTSCVTCLDANSGCDSSSVPFYEEAGYRIADSMVNLTNMLERDFDLIFNVYGPIAIQGIHDGLTTAMESVASTIGGALQTALASMGTTLQDIWEEIIIFGKRRRNARDPALTGMCPLEQMKHEKRSTAKEEAELRKKRGTEQHTDHLEKGSNNKLRDDRVKRATISSSCVSKCPACSAFANGNSETAFRQICGDSVVDTNATIQAGFVQYEAFYANFVSATLDLLTEVWLSSTHDVTKIKALKDGVYVVYDMSTESISYNMFDTDAMYTALAEFMYKQYSV